jgi:deazaflavin-dependent oxidoreductase (nitroreductase family)
MGRYSAARGRELTMYESGLERVAASRLGAWLFLHLINPLDQRLLPLSRGRLSLTVGAPVGLLQTIGGKTGTVRRTPLLYLLLRDGDEILVVASNGGSPRDPAWLHNVRADPDVRFLSREQGWRAYHAEVLTGADRAEAWPRALDLYAGYRAYQVRAGEREIPIVVLRAGAFRSRAAASRP